MLTCRFALAVPLVALFTACGTLTPNANLRQLDDRVDDRVRVAPEVVLLDDVEGVDSLALEHDRAVLWMVHGVDAPVSVGSIIVGVRDGGYLREVVAIERAGNRYLLETERSDLSKVFTDASWDLELQQVALRSAEAEFGQDWEFGGTVLVDEDFVSPDGGQMVNFSVHIADGAFFRMTPTIRTKADLFDGAVLDAGFQLEGTLDYAADFVVRTTGRVNEDVERVVLTREVHFSEFIGPIPVVGTARVNVVAGLRGSIDASISTTLHTEAHGAVHMGAGSRNFDLWTQGGCGLSPDWGVEGWNGNTEDCFGYEAEFRDTTATLDIHSQAFVRAEIAFSLYDSAGAEIQIEPWVEAWTCNDSDGSPALGVDFDAGVKGQHSYHYSVLWGLLEESVGPYTWGEDLRWDIYPSEPLTCGALL